MIDTVKLKFEVQRLNVRANKEIQFFSSGDKTFQISRFLLNIGSHSYNINLQIKDKFGYIEFSVPKFIRGYNVNDDDILSQDLYKSCVKIYRLITPQLLLCDEPESWQIVRLDYAFNFHYPIETLNDRMEKIQNMSFPRLKKYIYSTSCMFVSKTYSIKYYLKNPEYKKHDMNRIAKSSPILADKLNNDSLDVIRLELTMRSQALKRFFSHDRLTVSQFCDLPFGNEKLDDLISYSCDKLENQVFANNSDKKDKLINIYGVSKGSRLYMFDVMCNNDITRKLLYKSMHRTTIYRNKKLIELALSL